MPSIQLKKICKYICRDVNLEVRDGEFLVLLGANGSGKTTLLNIIAGLLEYEGSVLFDGLPVDTVRSGDRQVSYVFQDLVLFPHLTVKSNIGFGLRARKKPVEEIISRCAELLKLMKIEHLAERYPKRLSGGERQRVALARALAITPRVLLLDEPLSALDDKSAKYLRVELKQLHEKFGLTTVFVTHDLQEAEELADRIAIIREGAVEQVGKPEEIFFYPETEHVSEFIGAPNILTCDYCNHIGHGVNEVGCGNLPIIVPHDGSSIKRIAIFPRDVFIANTKPPGPDLNRFQGRITSIEKHPDAVRVGILAGDRDIVAELPYHTYEELELSVGKEIYLILKFGKIRVFEDR